MVLSTSLPVAARIPLRVEGPLRPVLAQCLQRSRTLSSPRRSIYVIGGRAATLTAAWDTGIHVEQAIVPGEGEHSGMRCLSRPEWTEQADSHRARVLTLTGGSVCGHDRHHPIFNFIFEYYRFKPKMLLEWSPGVGVSLEGADPDEAGSFLPAKGFVRTAAGGCYDPKTCPPKKAAFVQWTREFLEATAARQPVMFCFGLHEWAMLYSPPGATAPPSKHQALPLRVSQEQLNEVVQSRTLRCTHYDAFRFFTPEARPLNTLQPTRDTQPQLDQPGCVHANMDLFKWAVKLFPFLPSEALADSLELALECRLLDMRASPYDLSAYDGLGFDLSPVEVETREGRKQYQHMQLELYRRSRPVRHRLQRHCEEFLAVYNS